MNAAEVAKALNARPLSTGGYIAKCIAHDDKNPSMSIADGDKGLLLCCHAGCSGDDLMREARARGFAERSTDIPTVHRQLGPYSQHWDYHDASGRHVMRVCRWETSSGKTIRPLTLQSDRWTWKSFERDRPLYGLSALKDLSKRVIVVEGEKTADATRTLFPDFNAITWSGGSKAFAKTDWAPLAGRDVTLLADNDEPGRKAMDSLASILAAIGCVVRRADLAALGSLPDGWDVADALDDKSVDLDALWSAIDSAKSANLHSAECSSMAGIEPTARTAFSDRVYELVSVRDLLTECKPPEYIINGLFEEGIHVGIIAPPESGKSLFVLNAGTCVAAGVDFHGRPVKQGLVVYLAGEGHNGIKRRLQAVERRYQLGLINAPLVVSKAPASFIDPSEVLKVRDAINAAVELHSEPLRLLIVDTVARYLAPGDDNKAQDIAAYFAAVDALRGDATAISCHHTGHADATRARGSSNWKAGLDAEFSIAKDGDVMTITCQKMKDGDRPEPFSFRIEQEATMSAREDGSLVTSVVIAPTNVAALVRKPTGKNQKALLAELERRHSAGESVWTERDLRSIAKALGMGKSSTITTIIGLRQLGYLTDTIGGCRLNHAEVVEYGSTETVRKHNSEWVRGCGKVSVSIDTVLPSPISG